MTKHWLNSSQDYLTANDPTLSTPLTEDERSNLYAELASGAETGWDYSSRWSKEPLAGSAADQNPKLRALNVRGIIPVCLNSILCTSMLLAFEKPRSLDCLYIQTKRVYSLRISTTSKTRMQLPPKRTAPPPLRSARVSWTCSGIPRSLHSMTST